MPQPIDLRVGIDWDNDGYINFGVASTDAPNLIDSAPLHGDVGAYFTTGVAALNAFSPLYPDTDSVLGTQLSSVVENIMYVGFKRGYGNATRLGATQTGATALVTPSMIFPVTNGSTNFHTFQMDIRSTQNATVTIEAVVTYAANKTPGTVATVLGSTVHNLVANQTQRIYTQFSHLATNTHMRLAIRIRYTYVSGTKPNFYFSRYYFARQLVSHVNLSVFNSGKAAYKVEDITPYVVGIDWGSGNTSRDERIPADGSASIILRNDTGYFYPNNVSSPFYGMINTKKKVIIQLSDGAGGYETYWQGYIKKIGFVTDTPLNQTVSLDCVQPVWSVGTNTPIFTKMDEDYLPPNAGVGMTPLNYVERKNAPDILLDIFQKNISDGASPMLQAWRLGVSGLGYNTVLNSNPGLNTNYVDDVTLGVAGLGEALRYKYVGTDWDNLTYADIIERIVTSDYGWLFLDRSGQFNYYDRFWWHEYLVAYSLNLDNLSVSFSAEVPEEAINSVTVDWRKIYRALSVDLIPDPITTDDVDEDTEPDIYWPKRINVPYLKWRRMRKKLQKIIRWSPDDYAPVDDETETGSLDYNALHALYRAGFIPDNVEGFDFDADLHKIILLHASNAARITGATTDAAGALQPYSVITAATTGAGVYSAVDYLLPNHVWRRNARRDMFVVKLYNIVNSVATYSLNPVMFRAMVNINEGEQSLTVRNEASIAKYNSMYGHSLDNSIHTEEVTARVVAQQILSDYLTTGIGITQFTIRTNDGLSSQYGAIKQLKPGVGVFLTQSTLGISDVPHIIIDEHINYQNGVVEVVYTVLNIGYFSDMATLISIAQEETGL